ncbi:MAG: ThuA domain-containing protein [Balneolales bacterium]|nr:ThuA domain-containing protein [Balneolales bacterium]
MRKILFAILGILFVQPIVEAHEFKVLVFSKTAGFRHSSIEAGIAAIQQLGEDNGFIVDATEDASLFTLENLIQYDAVIFLSTTGDILNEEQQAAFEQYISTGKGFVGIHAASDTEYSWPWYGELVGAYFDSHPQIQQATIEVADKVHPSTNFLPDYWVRTDEWYNYRENPRGKVHVLATLDEDSYSGGNMGHDHPIAWLHSFGGGRAWYTGGGHTEESFSEPAFLNHILGGILYASGDVTGTYEGTVDEKFQVTVLDNNPLSPMALAVLPTLDVLYIERAGNLKLRSAETGLISNAGSLSVDSGREDGLIGIVLDPDFETNSWVYLFYSPTGVSEQRISRFDFVNNAIDLTSEKIILRIPVQRDQCCHSGGDLEFDTNGNLFIATGDNTNPFESDGFAPIDERDGREAWDAQGTSANTQSLVGKILRIHPEDDGTYSIPDGNLFADSTDGKREIYVMGTRNPFRMAISEYTNELVWGDVGPDAPATIDSRGPVGHDEFNRTSVAGNFGWPYCIADNLPYVDYNFATGVSGSAFDCSNLVNESPNNTGALNIPPAVPAWLDYTYGFTPDRPEFGEGDRTAIAGGFYSFDPNNVETGSFPQYYDSTLFILEWTRNWIKEVRFDEDGNLLQINPFLDDLELARPIDMQFGPDGAMYIVEWGTGFFADNEDARVIKIEYVENLGNRTPFALATASVTSGSAPLLVDFFGNLSSDPDFDFLTYSWDFNGDNIEDSSEENPSFTYTETGSYLVTLTVTDPEGASSVAQIQIVVGNTAPVVTIDYPLNGGFYEDFDTIEFRISVTDAEQGSTDDGGISCDDIDSEPSIGHDDHSHGEGVIQGCEGEFPTNPHGEGADDIFYVFNAEYTDDGGGAGAPLKGAAVSILQPKRKQAEHATQFIDLQTENTGDFLGGGLNVGFVNHNSALKYGPMNFEGVDFFSVRYASLSNEAEIEVRAGSVDGPLVAKVNTQATGNWQFYDYFTSQVTDPGGSYDDVYLVFKNAAAGTGLGNINWFEVHGQGIAKQNPDSLKGLAASYYPNSDFTGTPVVRQDPMIAWNWSDESPHEDIPADGFSVRWEGQLVAPSTGQYTIQAVDENGDVEVWIDGELRIFSFITSYTMDLVEGETHDIIVEYAHSSGHASMFLEWSGPNPQNVIHADYLIPDTQVLVSNEIETETPVNFTLSQNYPNPFNPSTNISFNIPTSGQVKLDVFNVLGQTVQVLADGIHNQGAHTVTFDASGYSSGVYFYRLEFEGSVLSNKMLLLK